MDLTRNGQENIIFPLFLGNRKNQLLFFSVSVGEKADKWEHMFVVKQKQCSYVVR
jgi:hypothetical protein